VTLTVGLLALVLAGPYAARLISPGQVALHHGEIGACGTCHEDFDAGPVAWFHAAFASRDPLADSESCLACHELGDDAFLTHGLSAVRLSEVTREIVARGPAPPSPLGLRASRALFGPPARTARATAAEMGCANCHEEHRGWRFDQTVMDDGRCQSCHSVQFDSFSNGHPGFGSYPFSRRTRIKFDHSSHFSRHFEKAGREIVHQTCTDCHTPAYDGRQMLADSFADTCAACHLGEIEGVDRLGPTGIPVLAVPGLDLVELRDRGAAIGEWPEWSEESLTPFMRLLLAGDATLRADMERLQSLDLLDLTGSRDEDIKAIERMVWGIKELIYRLTVSGVIEMEVPLSEDLGQTLGHVALGRLFGVIPEDVVRATQADWFPNLADELARTSRGERVLIPGSEDVEARETADEDATQLPAPPDGDDTLSQDESHILSGDEDDILSDDEGDILSGYEDDILSDDEGDILSGDEDDILSDDEGDILSDDEGDILSDGDDLSDEGGLAATATVEATEMNKVTMPETDAEQWALLGGWYGLDYVLYYKPLGHADRFVRAWLDFSGRTFGTTHQLFGAAPFIALADEGSPGRCTKCHSIDREADGAMNVKWKPRRPVSGLKTFTFFSHASHFSLLGEEGCLTCHALDPAARFAEGYNDRDPFTFSSNFKPVNAATCATCHVEARAGESCLLCHEYHIGPVETRAVHTRMQ
jgi:hypothetical protein